MVEGFKNLLRAIFHLLWAQTRRGLENVCSGAGSHGDGVMGSMSGPPRSLTSAFTIRARTWDANALTFCVGIAR